MPDFSHLAKLDVTPESIREYVFDDIVQKDAEGEDTSPSIWFAPMTDVNKDYLNERIRLSTKRAEEARAETKKQRQKRILSADQLEEDREQDRVLIARTCARKWGVAPLDTHGDAPEFSEENCYDFLCALPNYMIDPLRNWIQNVYNFVDKETTTADPDALGNSLPTS